MRASLCVWEKLLCIVPNANDLSKLQGPTAVTLFGPPTSQERQKTKLTLWNRFWNARTQTVATNSSYSGMTSNSSIKQIRCEQSTAYIQRKLHSFTWWTSKWKNFPVSRKGFILNLTRMKQATVEATSIAILSISYIHELFRFLPYAFLLFLRSQSV